MPLLDHFHPPLHGPRRWEGFHHTWAVVIAQELNKQLSAEYFAEPEISLGPELEIDVAAFELNSASSAETPGSPWAPPRAKFAVNVDFSHLDGYEVLIYQELGGAELRAAIELVSPANKDRAGSRRTFAAKCAGYLKSGVNVVMIDVVTSRKANLHAELFDVLEVQGRVQTWKSPTGLYAAAYRAVTKRKNPRIEVWPETLRLGKPLPVMPLWLSLELCIPLRLEQSYLVACQSLKISA